MLGINMHGFVSGSYNYNFNSPDSRVNTLGVFNPDANTFQVDYFNLAFSRNREDENLGFAASLDFGKTAEMVGAVTRWSNSLNSTESRNSIELREAYATYKLPIGDGIKLKAGKFVTLLGAEIIENWDNHNPNISRSISFGYGIPFTHTGLMASIPIADVVTIDMGVVNGWDNLTDNNDGKTFLGGIGITPADVISMYISGIYGPEQSDNGHSNRAATTAVLTIKPTDMVTLIGELTYGNEENAKVLDASKDAEWYGGAGYVVLTLSDEFSFALRGEVFDDTDGSRFLLTPEGATAWEVTPTFSYQVSSGLLWRTEYRHDEADKAVFQHDSNFVRGQDMISTQLIYSF
jgi:hypothetical protein